MTHQDPDYCPQPDRLARHADQARLLALPYQRALRLLMAAGITAAGLCLVIGAVALVAAAGGRSGDATVTPAAHQSPAQPSVLLDPVARDRHGAHGAIAMRPVPLLGRTGRESEITGRFRVGGTGTWQLSWSYDGCRGGRGAAFAVTDGSAAGLAVAGSGSAGHGVSRSRAEPGWHHLIIRSRCAWTIRVTGQH